MWARAPPAYAACAETLIPHDLSGIPAGGAEAGLTGVAVPAAASRPLGPVQIIAVSATRHAAACHRCVGHPVSRDSPRQLLLRTRKTMNELGGFLPNFAIARNCGGFLSHDCRTSGLRRVLA
jgi:hypothetical protein